jgi:hypothetical protein
MNAQWTEMRDAFMEAYTLLGYSSMWYSYNYSLSQTSLTALKRNIPWYSSVEQRDSRVKHFLTDFKNNTLPNNKNYRNLKNNPTIAQTHNSVATEKIRSWTEADNKGSHGPIFGYKIGNLFRDGSVK